MKKILALLLSFVLFAVPLAACGGSPAPSEPSDPAADVLITSDIVGEWDEQAGSWRYAFNEDGTGWRHDGNNNWEFTYEITETNLVLHLGSGGSGDASAAIEPQNIEYTLDGDELHLHFLNSDYQIYLLRQ